MPDLPERADIDQLRRQARELLRAAVAGEPQAQDIALGRWSFGGAGTIEVEEGELTLGILIAGPENALLEASLVVAEAVAGAGQSRHWFPELRDVTITDDLGSTSTLGPGSGHAAREPGPDQRLRFEVTCALDPVPEGGRRWLDVHGRGTSVTRLLRSGLAPVRAGGLSPAAGSPAEQELRNMAWWILLGYLDKAMREGPDLKRRCRDMLAQTATLREGGPADGASPLPGQFTRLCTALIRQRPASGLPSGWHSVLDAADRTDGPRLHVDLDTALPPVDDTAVRLNTLASWPGSWDLYLQATPGWWTYSTDRQHKRAAMTVYAEDDLGGLYISNFGGSRGRPGYEEVKLTMRPRLAPGASLLTLTFAGETQQVTAEIRLAPQGPLRVR